MTIDAAVLLALMPTFAIVVAAVIQALRTRGLARAVAETHQTATEVLAVTNGAHGAALAEIARLKAEISRLVRLLEKDDLPETGTSEMERPPCWALVEAITRAQRSGALAGIEKERT